MSGYDTDSARPERPRVVILGGGFAGLAAARGLGRDGRFDVTLLDRRNHHLFQPLLYQVATAGLSPADIAVPIRALLAPFPRVEVLQLEATGVDLAGCRVHTPERDVDYDRLIIACGARQSYFGNHHWEACAPGLKTIEQATEIRRRVLTAFERAERESDPAQRRRWLTFVVIGGGPTGVELAGALGEVTRYTLTRDFRHIDPALARIILVEATPHILGSFEARLAARAVRDLEKLGVQVWVESPVTRIDETGVTIGGERIDTGTVLWAAGVEAEPIGATLGVPLDRMGRVEVGPDLRLPGHPEVFVAGDLAHVPDPNGQPLPGLAPVALQQGRHLARQLARELDGQPLRDFGYRDKGQMATIGRSRAILEAGRLRLGGFAAWLTWIVIHIYYLTGFRNRIFVVLSWAWSYLSFRRGARLIVGKEWRTWPDARPPDAPSSGDRASGGGSA